MTFKWLIQDVSLTVSQMYRKYDALDSMNENVSGIGVIADFQYITGLEDAIEEDLDTKYIILGGVKILNLLKNAKSIKDIVQYPTEYQVNNGDIILKSLIKGIFYDFEKFDQKYYGNLNLPLLNKDAEYISLADNLNTSFNVDKFIKPTRDLKAFNAGIIEKGVKLKDYIKDKNRQRFYLEEDIVVSDVKTMNDEYRFFVVNNKVVTGSAYRVNGKVGENIIVPNDVYIKAEEYIKLYQPSDIFTMDLSRDINGVISIIEYNCFNCSGVYLCDLLKTYEAIKEYFISK